MKYAVAYKVYETTEYDDFNFLEENRGISDSHVANLIKSLNKGYEMPPIIVDEDMNVIDGQHRLTAHKRASKPVRFVVQQNIKDDTLQRANTDISKWTNNDHLMYHVKKKNENYIKLLEYITYAEVTITTGMSILGKSLDSKVKTKARVLQEGLFTVTINIIYARFPAPFRFAIVRTETRALNVYGLEFIIALFARSFDLCFLPFAKILLILSFVPLVSFF